MSRSASLYTTLASLVVADRILGPNRTWIPATEQQEEWTTRVIEPGRKDLSKIPEIVANATWEGAEHVAFLERHGMKAQLENPSPDSFLTAGVMDLGVEWIGDGERTAIIDPNNDEAVVDAARVSEGVRIYRSPEQRHDRLVACIKTKSGDLVWMTHMDTEAEGLPLAALATKVFDPCSERNNDPFSDLPWAPLPLVEADQYRAVTFPMVDLSQKADLDYMTGLYTFTDAGRRAYVAKAVQQLTFRMNHKGARARAADEMDITLECVRAEPKSLVIDGDFLLAVTRPGLSLPLFVSHVTREDWKDPGDL